MIALTFAEIAECTGGQAFGDTSVSVVGDVRIDSRLVGDGDIFVAVRGEHRDGHDFAAAAVAAGAALVIAERDLGLAVPQLVVADTVTALGDLARAVLARVREAGQLRVVGVTGSNGKTTTKNMLAAILSAEGATVAPAGSLNNLVGAPMTILRIESDTRFLVVEMGADAIGDVAHLVRLAPPDVGVVLKVGLAHVGKFGDVHAVELAKSEMVRELHSSATAVLNADDDRVARMAGLTNAAVRTFGLDASAHVRADDVAVTAAGTTFSVSAGDQSARVTLRILGEHHVSNALAAIATALALGVPLSRAVAALASLDRAERWRMELLTSPDGVTVVNDAYNASPDSMVAALKTLAQIAPPGRSFAVLGEMAELGDYADEEHDRIGRLAVRLNIGQLIVVGRGARHIHNAAGLEGSWDGESILVDDAQQAYDELRDRLLPGDVVLVKASNSVGLMRLGDRLAGIDA